MYKYYLFNNNIVNKLKSNRIQLSSKLERIELLNSNEYIPYSNIHQKDWGFVYEKLVGQHFEDIGYDVIYQGLENMVLDFGIDLIVNNDSKIKFIQCKYTLKGNIIGKQQIEKILYKAGNYISKYKIPLGLSPEFMLCINSTELIFRRKSTKVKMLPQFERTGYPILDYFLSQNYTQDIIKLDFMEFPIIR